MMDATTSLGIGMGRAYEGAASGPLSGDQAHWDIHPQDAYQTDADVLGARSANLVRNNSYARAMLNAVQSGVVGPHGLLFKSLYVGDQIPGVTDEDRAIRRTITRNIAMGMRHIDVSGMLTFRQWEDSLVFGRAVYGGTFKVRVAKNRPQARYATAWRCIHPNRICNPDNRPDADNLYRGIQLNADGDPIGIHIRSSHPNKMRQGKATWIYVPLLDANGVEQVIWHSARLEPEQIRSPGWFTPIMQLLTHIGKVTEAHVVGTRLKACLGMIVEADDPIAAAKADRNGVAWTKNTKIVPGKTYYIKKGSNVRPFEFKFDGSDFDIFTTAMLTPATAAFGPGIPFQLALHQLTKSNMASARAALMQSWRSFRREQVDHEHELRIVVKNYIAEDIARGRLVLPTGDDLDAACAGFFVPPQRLSSDEYREMQGAQLKKEVLGVSESTLSREYGGYDHDDERAQTAEDNALDERAGLNRNAETKTQDDPQYNDDGEEIDPNEDPANEKKEQP